MPLKLAQENPTLLKALVEAKSDAPPCLDAAGIQKVRAFVRSYAEGLVLALLPTQDASEPTGFDSPAAFEEMLLALVKGSTDEQSQLALSMLSIAARMALSQVSEPEGEAAEDFDEMSRAFCAARAFVGLRAQLAARGRCQRCFTAGKKRRHHEQKRNAACHDPKG